MWPKVLVGTISRESAVASLRGRTWKAICKHAEECVASSLPHGIMSLTSAAEKAGYNKIALLRILKKHEAKISVRNGRRLETVRPQMVVAWEDVLEALKIENEYMTSIQVARELGARPDTLLRVARELGIVREEKKAGKAILIHKDHIESIRQALPKSRRQKQANQAASV